MTKERIARIGETASVLASPVLSDAWIDRRHPRGLGLVFRLKKGLLLEEAHGLSAVLSGLEKKGETVPWVAFEFDGLKTNDTVNVINQDTLWRMAGADFLVVAREKRLLPEEKAQLREHIQPILYTRSERSSFSEEPAE